MLHAGPTREIKERLERFLAGHGYQQAPVTLDNSDWMFAYVYRIARDRGYRRLAKRVRDNYVPYMELIVSFFEQRSVEVVGREIPQVLLIHANRLNAEIAPALLSMLNRRGYRFVSLEEALSDEAYRVVSAVLITILFGVMDYGRIFGAAERSANAANAGAAFAALSVANTGNLTAITNAARANAPDATAMTVSSTSFCTCTLGGAAINCSTSCATGSKRTYVRVSTALPFQTLVQYPLLPGSTTLRSSATVRIQRKPRKRT